MLTRVLVAAAAAGLMGVHGAAMAQPAQAPALLEVENESMTVQPFGMTVDQLEDTNVYSAAGDRIGEVDEVLMTPDGRAAAVSMEVGGFLGVGDREVIVMLDQFERQGDRLVTALTKPQVEALPVWDD